MAWEYGASPINWCNDDLLDLGDEFSVEEILGEMREAGVHGTEMGRKFPRDAQQLKEVLAAFDLQLISGWAQIHVADRRLWSEEMAQYERHLALLEALGCSVVVTAEGSGSVHWDRNGDRSQRIPWGPDEWDNVLAGLTEAGKRAAGHGLSLVYHPHLGTNIENESEIVRLLEGTQEEWVALVLDTGHLGVAGVDVSRFVRRFGARIKHVHFKSFRQSVVQQYWQGLGFLDAVRQGLFTVPGDGDLGFGPIVSALYETGYRGWCVIEAEQDPKVAPPLTYLRRALQYLEDLEAQV
ncbi:MAG: myo-inosose-2 dehydratase [Firmicutes bacterium]|nr:myo-inosose-2 dehydratase [Bacillota bacterium]